MLQKLQSDNEKYRLLIQQIRVEKGFQVEQPSGLHMGSGHATGPPSTHMGSTTEPTFMAQGEHMIKEDKLSVKSRQLHSVAYSAAGDAEVSEMVR